jgi:hypothetical protein
MLNFKHGLYSSLFNEDGSNKIAINNGTIYVTTDEKAMYVDLNDTRIRLSQIITLTTHNWQELPPPYSTEAFYYLVDTNALLKYKADGTWVQINSTTELSNALNALTQRVKTAEDTITAQGVTLTNLKAAVEDETTGLAATKVIADAAAKAIDDYDKAHANDYTNAKIDEVVADAKKAGTDATTALNNHKADKNNPHEVTAAQIGLGNVNNTADADKPVSTAQAEAIAAAKDAVIGTDTDAATKVTVYGAKKAAAEALTHSQGVATTFNNYKATNDAAIAEIKGTDANFDSFEDVKSELVKTYATKTYAEDQAKAVLGAEGNNAGDKTVYGAHAAAAEAMQKAKDAASAASTNATNLANEKGRIDAILEGADSSMVNFKQVFDAIEDVKGDINKLDDEYATNAELEAAKEAILGEKGYTGTVKGAYEAAAAAQTTANNNAGAITAIKDGQNIDSFADVEAAIAGVNETIGKLDETYATNNELAEAVEAVLGEADYKQTVKSAYELANTANVTATNNAGDITTMKAGATITTFAGIEGEIAKVNEAIGKLNDTYATDDEVATAVSTAKNELTTAINGVDDKADKNAAQIALNKAAIETLEGRVTTELQAADALQYKGTIATAGALPTENVEIGFTYKVVADILKTELADVVNFDPSTAEDAMIHVGDLLIATGTETDGVIGADLKWDHVPSGYHADYTPTMDTAITTRDDVTTAQVKLTSAHAADGVTGDLGTFQLSGAAGSAVTISGAGNSIAIGMTWGTF